MRAPAGFEEIQRQEMSRLFGLFTRARLVLIPTLLAFLAWVWWVDPQGWRSYLLSVAVPVLIALFVFEFRRWRRRGLSPHAIDRNLGIAVSGILVISTVSGGLESPFLPVMLVVTVAMGMFATPALATWLMGIQILAVWTFTVLALTRGDAFLRLQAIDGNRPPLPARALTLAVILTLLLVMGRYVGRFVRRAFDAMLRRTVRAQAESLRAHAERAQELTALSAEIAHELKNPLASVKGLAGLLGPQLPEGKGAERLGVLRREVDRMQVILDEFLNFSRPLVPLALGTNDLVALCREVEALHEGMAQERGVALEVEADGEVVLARCDPRKVKQVLINLVQNAIDAAPDGSAVTLAASTTGSGAEVRVLDRGPGLDPAVAAQVFEPGVTTKPAGSGLGLTIARALARQHGGDLSLLAREGGGAEARLTLPAEPAAAVPPPPAAPCGEAFEPPCAGGPGGAGRGEAA
ncbi:MAG: HAMP domain-containing histidine kinase [Anaeromyxobacter sp.]|nr:HAMP domain-containing histidine kinase [Anaeromyxobacter sp.]MBL0276363.1 HAMP domain-containing histidine kinase [Anaeromyxobacter sp.]